VVGAGQLHDVEGDAVTCGVEDVVERVQAVEESKVVEKPEYDAEHEPAPHVLYPIVLDRWLKPRIVGPSPKVLQYLLAGPPAFHRAGRAPRRDHVVVQRVVALELLVT